MAEIAERLEGGLAPCRALAAVKDVRVLGAIGVVELHVARDREALKAAFLAKGVWVRPLGGVILPDAGFTISEGELATLTGAVCDVVSTL